MDRATLIAAAGGAYDEAERVAVAKFAIELQYTTATAK